jgi:uncharacterized membrane protein YgcG
MLAIQWIAFPVVLLAVGYYIIGPRIGELPLPFAMDEKQPPAPAASKPDKVDAPTPDTTDSDSTASQKYSPPDVDVSVEPGAQFAVRRGGTFHARRHSKRRHSRSTLSGGAAPAENGGGPAGGSDGGGSTDGGGGGGGVVNW